MLLFRSVNYCRIFTELAESFLEKIVSGSTDSKPHYALKILDLVLTCVGHHDYEVSVFLICFPCWRFVIVLSSFELLCSYLLKVKGSKRTYTL